MKRKPLIWIFFILFAFIGSVAQINRDKKSYKQQAEEANRLYNLDKPTEQTDSTALFLFTIVASAAAATGDDIMAADCYIKAGNIHQTYQRFEQSNSDYHRALLINQRKENNLKVKYEACLYMGSSYYFSNIIDSARYYFEQASGIATTYTSGKLPEEERLYNSLGAIYFESANYQQAKNYFEKALLLTPVGNEDEEESLVGISSNIANCLLRLNQYDSALRIYQSLHRYTMQPEVKEIIDQNTAHTYFELGQYDSALLIYQTLSSDNALNRIKALNDIGRIYMNRGLWQQSEAVFDSAIAVNKKISSRIRNKEEALAYLFRGQLAARQGLTDEAITWCNEALQEVHLNFTWKSADDLPEEVSQTVSPLTLFEILKTKASLLTEKFRRDRQPAYLQAALRCYRKAIETANYIKLSFDNDEAKLFFNQNYRIFYNEAIEAAYTKHASAGDGLDDYIFIVENYKGNILHQNLKNVLLKSNANVPDSIRDRENELKQLLAFYTSRMNNNGAESDVRQLQKRLAELQVELSRLQKQYEKDESYNLFRNQSVLDQTDLKAIQSAIDDKTALLNYYKTDSVIYLLAISQKKALLTRISADSVFNQHLQTYLDEVYRHAEGSRYNGFESSSALYSSLLAPVSSVINSCDKWIIIPDGLLYYLPVEGLTVEKNQREYVIENRVVSYHYSFSLLFQQKTHHISESEKPGTVAFAPFAGTDAGFNPEGMAMLPFSKSEVQQFERNSYLGPAATKKKFIQTAPDFPFIHLATHASAGSDSSGNWIQFYSADSNELNNKLFLNEIYNLDLHRAELVILSACETGSGHITSGEGLLSLSRAFLYAGSDGIISTLWKTEDQVTAYLMQRLHFHLSRVKTPEKALQLAKTDLLNDKSISARYKTPNYWGNFIYVGKVSLQPDRKSGTWWIVAGVAGLLFILYGIKKSSGKNRNLVNKDLYIKAHQSVQ
jgi:CHAT domain-containing protein/tetratricopeptide (TPR) repeat protein